MCDDTKPGVVNTQEDQKTIQEDHNHPQNRSELDGMEPNE